MSDCYRIVRLPRPRAFKYRIERKDRRYTWFAVGYASTLRGARRAARVDMVKRGIPHVVEEFSL